MHMVFKLKNRCGDIFRVEVVALLDIIDVDLGLCLDILSQMKCRLK
jgi:hypothetical protein